MVIQERIKLLEEQLEENGELGELGEATQVYFGRITRKVDSGQWIVASGRWPSCGRLQ